MSGNVFLSICHKRSLRDVIRSTAGFSFTNQFSQKHWHYTIRNGWEFTRHLLSRVDWLVRNRVSRSTNIQVDKPYLIGKHSKFISSNCRVVNLDKQFDKYCLSTWFSTPLLLPDKRHQPNPKGLEINSHSLLTLFLQRQVNGTLLCFTNYFPI